MLSQVKREATGVRLSSALEIDGKLDDPAWNHVPENAQFIQYAPQPGQSPSQSTSVKIAYDDNALYIGARMWDTAPDSILHQLSERDETQNTDEFGIWFSPFNDGLNAVRFITTPDGVQIDEQISPNGNDPSWDAVWDVVCSIDSLGWVAEFRIPWMAFRFPENSNQRWGMNMFRSIRRHREESVWNPMDPTQRLLNQGGVLTGIAGV
ncbi:MAG: carbohydrate binding family 9 domain-containing protein, partial [Flavobacteriales bacterium]